MDDDREVLSLDGAQELTQITRHQFNRMIQAVKDEALTQEDLDILFDDFLRDVQRRAAANRRRGK